MIWPFPWYTHSLRISGLLQQRQLLLRCHLGCGGCARGPGAVCLRGLEWGIAAVEGRKAGLRERKEDSEKSKENERETSFLILLKNEWEMSETQESSDAVKTLLLSTCTNKVRGLYQAWGVWCRMWSFPLEKIVRFSVKLDNSVFLNWKNSKLFSRWRTYNYPLNTSRIIFFFFSSQLLHPHRNWVL